MEFTTKTTAVLKDGSTACKISIEEFKAASDNYSRKAIKELYRILTGITPAAGVNHWVSNGSVYLVPETGSGIEKDALNLDEARTIL